MPELPQSLSYLMCDKPFDEYIEIMEATPEEIQCVNARIQSWTDILEKESKVRCVERCAKYKERIMMKVWHPSRMEMLINMGYDVEDM
jgi:hypothetical protein